MQSKSQNSTRITLILTQQHYYLHFEQQIHATISPAEVIQGILMVLLACQ
jgi:predicted membrane-bound dolichyl-phosphate-mannose-protein mannosyltransferase